MKDFFIGIELTRHCNLRCAHCFRADLDKVSEIPFETVEKILVEGKRYHKPHIALTGGETTLHSRFREILDLIIHHGYTFHFVTNGYNHQRIFRNLYDLFDHPQWIGVSISMDGATEKTHDAIRGRGSFARALATVAISRIHNLEVVVQMVVHRGNRHEMEDMALLCSKIDTTRLHIAHAQPTPHLLKHNLMPSPQEYKGIEREVGDLRGRFRMPIILSAGFYDQTPLAHCRFLKLNGINIDHRGRLTTCCQLSNLEGSYGEEDVVADLSKETLEEGHQKLLQAYNQLFSAKLKKIGDGSQHDLDHFHCWNCMKHFKKAEWMRDHPENEWVQQDPYFKGAQ